MSERLCAVGGSLELRPSGPPGFRLIASVPTTGGPAATADEADDDADADADAEPPGRRPQAAAREALT